MRFQYNQNIVLSDTSFSFKRHYKRFKAQIHNAVGSYDGMICTAKDSAIDVGYAVDTYRLSYWIR